MLVKIDNEVYVNPERVSCVVVEDKYTIKIVCSNHNIYMHYPAGTDIKAVLADICVRITGNGAIDVEEEKRG